MTNDIYDRIVREMPVGLDRSTLRVLSYHIGREKAIGRADLVEALRGAGFDAHERLVRRAIHDLRRTGHLVCSAPGESGGYYLAANLGEFREFCDRELHPKAVDMLETESKMKEAAQQQFGDAVQVPLI